MKTRLPFFVYLFFTVTILLYSAIRLLGTDPIVTKLVIKSNRNFLSPELQSLFIKNNPAKIIKEIQNKFPELENVSIKNHQNRKLEILLKYKKIIAIWTDGKSFYPLSENGIPIMQKYVSRPSNRLVFKGEIPKDFKKIMAFLHEIEADINYLEYIENRRWNMIMNNGAKIMLPEENLESTVLQIKPLLGKKFTELDLRNDGRILGSGFKE